MEISTNAWANCTDPYLAEPFAQRTLDRNVADPIMDLYSNQTKLKEELKMKEKFIVGIVALGTSAVVGGAAYVGRKVRDIAKKVGMSISELANAEVKDIQREMVEQSVQHAADREVRKYAKDAANEALSGVKAEVRSQVKKAVNEAFDDMKKSVEDEISTQIAAIDHAALRKDVTEQARKKILDKFDGNLDDILSDFSDNLDRVKKIYTSISDTLTKRDSDHEIRFKVG